MDDRYRPRRPRSPTYNPGRASLPINVGHVPTYGGYHLHAVPGRQEVITNPRSSGDRLASPVTTTTYKVAPDIPGRSNSVRDGHRHRSSTLDSYGRPVVPAITTTAPRYRPVIHSAVAPVSSPSTMQYRAGEEDYYAVPASSGSRDHHHHNRYHHKRFSTMDNSDVSRITEGREEDRLGVGYGREGPRYSGTRSRPVYPRSLVRHPDTVADDYGDDGYGYTNPRDLAQYDLDHSGTKHHSHSRRDSFEPRSRPTNLSATYYDGGGYSRSYENRERGLPPSSRGFDRIPPGEAPYDQGGMRMPAVPQPPPPIPAKISNVDPSFDSDEHRRSSRRPVSLYQERDHRRPHRDEYYERDDDLRERFERRHEQHDDRHDERHDEHHDDKYRDRYDERTHPSHGDRPERSDKTERDDRSDHKDKKDRHGLRDTLVGIAATSLGLVPATIGSKDDERDNEKERSDRDEPRRSRDKDYGDDSRRRREYKEGGDPVDLTGRDPLEKPSYRDDRDRGKNHSPSTKDNLGNVDLSGRDPKERPRSRDERDKRDKRDSDGETHSRRRSRRDSDANSNAVDDSSDSAAAPRSRQPRSRRESGPSTPFNPKDTMDLKALKEALAAKDASAKKESPPTSQKESRDAADIRPDSSGRDDRGRSDEKFENRQLRVVSPPREKSVEKPVKGILRQPRERFPEDPVPIREGVAPHKDAKKDGIPPDARWTKISRRLVNPEALEAGMERYEAREDFVIVLRVLTKEEVQTYANLTQKIRAEREEAEEIARRRARRERHERHKRESYDPRRHRSRHYDSKDRSSHSESDSTDYDEDDRFVYGEEKPKMLEGPPPKSARPLSTAERAIMSGGLGP
ncbi:hypothetical protein B7463_g6739, partial [Scytalidium lignicola]